MFPHHCNMVACSHLLPVFNPKKMELCIYAKAKILFCGYQLILVTLYATTCCHLHA